jgi:hypothetical protein
MLLVGVDEQDFNGLQLGSKWNISEKIRMRAFPSEV